MKLDKQYKFLHINIYEDDTKLTYDSLLTLRNFSILDKKMGLYGIFDEVLNKFGIEHSVYVNDLDDPKIIWIDYKENYITSKKEYDRIQDDDDDEDDDGHIPRFFPIGMIGVDQHEMTPWGKFTESDPMNPMNLYKDIKVMNFKGFSLEDISRLELTMNSIRGVARWSIIDKYSVIICVATAYSAQEVMKNIEDTLYENLDVRKFSALEESAMRAQQESEEMEEDHIILIFPNGSKRIIENPSDQDIIDVNNILGTINNTIAFKNGEIYEGGESSN